MKRFEIFFNGKVFKSRDLIFILSYVIFDSTGWKIFAKKKGLED